MSTCSQEPDIGGAAVMSLKRLMQPPQTAAYFDHSVSRKPSNVGRDREPEAPFAVVMLSQLESSRLLDRGKSAGFGALKYFVDIGTRRASRARRSWGDYYETRLRPPSPCTRTCSVKRCFIIAKQSAVSMAHSARTCGDEPTTYMASNNSFFWCVCRRHAPSEVLNGRTVCQLKQDPQVTPRFR